ncbi:MAG: hypothetical protein HY895_06255 [Deltaproteobacteria bacterium]|nr:hypothetical protein [Deltaproteobacteria bacterium]
MQTKVKGRTTIRAAAICFLASAVFELLDLASPVPLLGAMRSGLTGMGYHLIFTAVFSGMGIGLWTGKAWGYGMLMAGTAAYSIDKAQLLLAPQTFYEFILQQFTTPSTREIFALVPKDLALQVMTAAYLVIVLCWWGFAFYIHRRRSYFDQGAG